MNVNAVIFDLNGTIVADEDEWGKAFNKVLSEFGIETGSDYPHIGGIGVEENWRKFIEKYSIKTSKTPEELAIETKKEYYKLLPEVKLKKGFKKLVKDLKDSNIKVAMATSSTWESMEKVVDKFGIEKYFDSITTGEEVDTKKPDPEIFEKAAQKLDELPENCLVFEDSESGVEAAHAAGMKVIAVYRDKEMKDKLENAEYLVRNFSEVSPGLISKLK